MPILIPNQSSTIHESCYAYIILHYIHVSHYNIHTQTNIKHPRINKHLNTALSRPAPRSGWRVSLRRDVLAQASPLRPGEPPSPRRGLKKASRNQRGISLRRDPSRLSEILALSKRRVGRLGDLSRKKGLGESLFISPRRDWPAWARFTGLATVFLQQFLAPAQTTYSYNSFKRSEPK